MEKRAKAYAAILISLLIAWAALPMAPKARAAVNPAQKVNVSANEKMASVDGKKVNLAAPGLTLNGQAFVPFKTYAIAFGGTASYDSRTKTAKASIGKTTVVVANGGSSATVNGKKMAFKPAPTVKNGELYVAAQTFGTWFGYEFLQIGTKWNSIKLIIFRMAVTTLGRWSVASRKERGE